MFARLAAGQALVNSLSGAYVLQSSSWTPEPREPGRSEASDQVPPSDAPGLQWE